MKETKPKKLMYGKSVRGQIYMQPNLCQEIQKHAPK